MALGTAITSDRPHLLPRRQIPRPPHIIFTTDKTRVCIFLEGINVGAARIFSGYEEKYGRRVVGVGLDTPSQDHGPSTHYPTHIELAAANIYGLENLADMSELPTKGFQLMVMPMNVKGGSGAPVRVIANFPDPDSNLSKSGAEVWPALRMVHGKPRYPQSQGSVERANRDIMDMLLAWLTDNESQD
ncbi:hypothetical protein Pmani_019771 [Petrolisthes manimaculis]|uniref:Uncharacterized protein n=1 Tax=Petrolisthes manimaculis TaxID=1843537 RepID=A0AAE1PHM3_9EUCA|nr:hypothetical protein Pmani_019771 [Petrolisthes manimaculis]